MTQKTSKLCSAYLSKVGQNFRKLPRIGLPRYLVTWRIVLENAVASWQSYSLVTAITLNQYCQTFWTSSATQALIMKPWAALSLLYSGFNAICRLEPYLLELAATHRNPSYSTVGSLKAKCCRLIYIFTQIAKSSQLLRATYQPAGHELDSTALNFLWSPPNDL